MALACLACHALDNSTDSFRMDRSFRTQNLSVRSVHSDDGQDGCGVAACFSKHNSKTAPQNDRQLHHTPEIEGGRTFRDSSSRSSKVSHRRAIAPFGRQQPDVSLDRMVFPEPRLTRCHAVRRDLFSNWTVGEVETEFEGRQLCFDLPSTTA